MTGERVAAIERREGEGAAEYLRRIEATEAYLFHGSPVEIAELEPREPVTDATDNPDNKRIAVYAYSSAALAAQRAILPLRSDVEGDWDIVGGTNPDQPGQPLLKTTPNLTLGKGFIHVVPRSSFVHTGGYQWISESPVRPEAVVAVDPEVYGELGGVHEYIT